MASTGAAPAQTWVPSTRQESTRSKSEGLAFVATMWRHGCSVYDDADHRAASKTDRRSSPATGRSAKA